jgi:hypothetical protein
MAKINKIKKAAVAALLAIFFGKFLIQMFQDDLRKKLFAPMGLSVVKSEMKLMPIKCRDSRGM